MCIMLIMVMKIFSVKVRMRIVFCLEGRCMDVRIGIGRVRMVKLVMI